MKKFFLCYFETTRECNLDCPYCMSKTEGDLKEKELSTKEIKHLVIDEVKKFSPYSTIAFSGGEFLLRKDALDILEHTSKNGLWSFINTNAKLIDDRKISEIKESAGGKVIFVFSINSIDKNIHWWSRNDRLKTIQKASKICLKNGIPFFFIITISRKNLNTLKKTMDYLQKMGIPMLRSPFVLRGAGRDHKDLLFTKDDMKDIIHKSLRENYLSYVSYTPFFCSPELLEEKSNRMNVVLGQLGCQAAKGFVGISPEGEVAPCVHLLDSKVRCGNVKEESLSDILNKNELLLDLRERKLLKGKCGICRYKNTCGGCRALAYYHTGDHLAEDPVCFFEPENETTRSEYEDLQNKNTEKFIEFLKQNDPWKSLF